MRVPGGGTVRRLAAGVVRSELLPNRLRGRVYACLGLRGAAAAWFSEGVSILKPTALIVGEGCYINREVYIDNGPVTLGRNVYLGPRSIIITAEHSVGGADMRAGPGGPQPVRVGDGAWIGAGAVILPGVTVGAGCVVAAGAVVTQDCDPNGLYAGVPAVRKKDLSPGVSP